MKKNRLYSVMALACLAGWSWLFFSNRFNSSFSTCFIKNISGFPCPACGTTRAVTLLMHGDLFNAVMLNPFAILVVAIMIVLPVWIAIDVLSKKQSLFDFYHAAEKRLQIRWLAALLVALVLANWVWNFKKGL